MNHGNLQMAEGDLLEAEEFWRWALIMGVCVRVCAHVHCVAFCCESTVARLASVCASEHSAQSNPAALCLPL